MSGSPEDGENLQAADPGASVQHRRVLAASYEGPLPPAGELQRYDEVVPGLAEKIVEAWIEESGHRRELDKVDQRSFYKLALRGQWMAALLAAGIFSGSIYLVRSGHDLAGISMVMAEIVALCWAFIAGRRRPVDPDADAEEPAAPAPAS